MLGKQHGSIALGSPLIGVAAEDQLRENLQAADFHIDSDLRQALETLGDRHFNPCP